MWCVVVCGSGCVVGGGVWLRVCGSGCVVGGGVWLRVWWVVPGES